MDADPENKTPRRLRLTLGAGVVLILLGAAVAVLVAATGPHGESTMVSAGATADPGSSSDSWSTAHPSATPGEASGRAVVFVHILGEVAQPGLYELHDGDRAIDAVAAAGGLTPAADQTQLNLARFLSDGEQIIVPAIGAVQAPASGTAPGTLPGSSVNINTADATALEGLPGVGPALAERIVAWREENGNFGSADDLLNVSGIGEKTLEKFRDNVST